MVPLPPKDPSTMIEELARLPLTTSDPASTRVTPVLVLMPVIVNLPLPRLVSEPFVALPVAPASERLAAALSTSITADLPLLMT